MLAFSLQKGWKKQGPKRPGRGDKEKKKRDYVVEAGKIRKTISIAKAELGRLRSNKKLTKKGKRNRAILKEECKHIAAAELINYMERKKALLRKLKKGFCRRKRVEEVRRANQQFKLDAGQVYANNIEEASGFWRELWEGEGTGNSDAQWLVEVRSAIYSRVPPPSEEAWALETSEAARVLTRKKNWSAPGPDRLTNFWWKRASSLLWYMYDGSFILMMHQG